MKKKDSILQHPLTISIVALAMPIPVIFLTMLLGMLLSALIHLAGYTAMIDRLAFVLILPIFLSPLISIFNIVYSSINFKKLPSTLTAIILSSVALLGNGLMISLFAWLGANF